jgi:hypothetical protein
MRRVLEGVFLDALNNKIKHDNHHYANRYLRGKNEIITKKLNNKFFGKFVFPWMKLSINQVDTLLHERMLINNTTRSNHWYSDKGYMPENSIISIDTNTV